MNEQTKQRDILSLQWKDLRLIDGLIDCYCFRVKVELALPLINDTLYECKDAQEVTTETWEEKVTKDLSFQLIQVLCHYKIFT